jgi:L-iditol 2-dehydrogenase
MDFETGVMLEPLAIAVHATDHARIRVGSTVAILGAGPMGLCLLQMAKLAGATQVFVSDKFDWRLKLAKRLGGIPINVDKEDAVKAVERATHGRGVDTAIEAAWADRSVQQGADMVKRGGMLVLVGIPGDDKLQLQASTVRRKGATILLVRRMKHCYPRTLDMAVRGLVDLKCMITHRVPLRDVAQAVALNAAYKDKVTKVIVQVG